MSLYEVVENNTSYKDVCDRGSSSNAKKIRNAFSGLRCPAERLHEWNAQSKNYTKRFVRAKQCLQRRITRMKKFSAKTEQQKESRRKHIYPIEVAYTYGKNCARKIATQKNINDFTRSTNALIKHVSESQENITDIIPESLNAKIQANHRSLNAIAKTPYYSPEQWNTINKYREGAINSEVLSAYNSIIDSNLHKLGYALVTNTNVVAANVSAANVAATNAKPNRKRTRRIQKLSTSAVNARNELNLNAFALSSIEREEHTWMLFDDVIINWYNYIDSKNNLAMCNYYATSVKDTMETCVDIIASFPESKKTMTDWMNKNKSLLLENDKLLHIYKTNVNVTLNNLHKSMEILRQNIGHEELQKYIHDINGLCNNLYELNDDRMFDSSVADKDSSIAIQIQNFNKFVKSSFHEMYAKQQSLIAYIIEQNKVKSVIEAKKLTRENTIGKMFFDKLNDIEQKKTDAYKELLQMIALRTSTFEEFASTIPKTEKNPYVLMHSIKRFKNNIQNVVLFDPSTYY
jgi:hypothetical protein